MLPGSIVLLSLFHLIRGNEELPGYSNDVDPPLMYNGERMKFGMGTVKDSYGAAPYLQVLSFPPKRQ